MTSNVPKARELLQNALTYDMPDDVRAIVNEALGMMKHERI
jgi:hypothetical protein